MGYVGGEGCRAFLLLECGDGGSKVGVGVGVWVGLRKMFMHVVCRLWWKGNQLKQGRYVENIHLG